MSAFEFYFSFFGLILGIAVANVGIGFGRLWRARERADIGVCLPLLGLWLICHAILNWLAAWTSLQTVPITAGSLFIGLFVAMPYVVVSTVMFPDDADGHASLERFYLSHSRLVMIAMMVPTTAGQIGYLTIFGQSYTVEYALRLLIVYYAVPFVLLFWRNLWAHRIGLGLASVLLIWDLFT